MVLLDVVSISGACVLVRIETISIKIIIYSLLVFLFCLGDVFLRHGEVPGNILVARLGDNCTARNLSRIIWIHVDDFPLPCVFVPRSLERAVSSTPCQLACLKFQHVVQIRNLVVFRIPVHTVVLEVIYGVLPSLLAGFLFRTYRGNSTDVFGVYLREGCFFRFFLHSVQVDVLVYIYRSIRKLQTGISVFCRVNITCAAQREQTGKEFHFPVIFLCQIGKPLKVAKLYHFAAFCLAEIYRITVRPHFRFECGGDAVAAESRVPALHIPIINSLVICGNHCSDAPQISACTAVHVINPKLKVFARTTVVTEFRGGSAFLEQHQRVFRIVYRRIELHAVFVSLCVLLFWTITGLYFITHAFKFYVIIYIQRNVFRVCERCRYAAFPANLFCDRRRSVRAGCQSKVICFIVYFQFHFIVIYLYLINF